MKTEEKCKTKIFLKNIILYVNLFFLGYTLEISLFLRIEELIEIMHRGVPSQTTGLSLPQAVLQRLASLFLTRL